MGTNRVIKTDNEIDVEGSNINLKATTDITGDCNISSNLTASGTVQGFTFPSDGTNGQILSTNGSGALSFIDAATGGVDTDVIANASDASSYSGTARFIHITSTADVTFSNTIIKDRIIYCERSITITFSTHNFLRNTVFHNSELRIISPHTTPSAGAGSPDTLVRDCEIVCNDFVGKAGSIYNSSTEAAAGLKLEIANTSIRTMSNITFGYNSNGFGEHENFTSKFLTQKIINDSNTEAVDCDRTVIQAEHVKGAFLSDGANIAIANGTAGTDTTTILNSSGSLLSGSYQHPFSVLGPNLSTQVILIASTDAGQTIADLATSVVVCEDKQIDNTNSYSTSGIFTAPVKGIYAVNANIAFAANSSFDVGELLLTMLVVNGSIKVRGSVRESVVSNDQVVFYSSQLSAIVELNQSDTVALRVQQSSGTNRTLNATGVDNYIHIHKIN